jgi:hypothetical protein
MWWTPLHITEPIVLAFSTPAAAFPEIGTVKDMLRVLPIGWVFALGASLALASCGESEKRAGPPPPPPAVISVIAVQKKDVTVARKPPAVAAGPASSTPAT